MHRIAMAALTAILALPLLLAGRQPTPPVQPLGIEPDDQRESRRSVRARQAAHGGSRVFGTGPELPLVFASPPWVGWFPGDVTADDFDGDGVPDLAVANFGSDDLSILIGEGRGAFARERRTRSGDSPKAIATGDFDGDGDADLAVVNFHSNDLSIHLGRGDGSFDDPEFVPVENYPHVLVSLHLDGDTFEDLVIAHQRTAALTVLLGRGDGTFATLPLVPIPTRSNSIAFGDLNGDSWMDLVLGDVGVSYLAGRGDGTFVSHVAIAPGEIPKAVALEDLDFDGNLDLVTMRYDVTVRLGNGDGTFQAASDIARVDNTTKMGIGEFNGDAIPDIAATGGSRERVHVFLGHGDGSFEAAPMLVTGEAPAGLSVADLDGDGLDDVAVTNSRGDNITLSFAREDGRFLNTRVQAGSNPLSVTVDDVDGNDLLDLITVNPVEDEVLVLRASSDGTYLPAETYEVNWYPRHVASGDFDGDGDVDLAATNTSSDDLTILDGLGDGTFTFLTSLEVGEWPYHVTSVDLDASGRPDLVACNRGSDDLSLFLSGANGQFGPEVRIPLVVREPRHVATGDVNLDDNADLVVSSFGGMSVLLGNGDGTFSPQILLDVGLGPIQATINDLDGDGVPDLAVAAGNYGGLIVVEGHGDGTFSKRAELRPGQPNFSPQAVASADVNDDGLVDLVSPRTEFGHSVTFVLMNAGDWEFAEQSVVVGETPSYAVLRDLNDDNLPDLVVSNALSGDLSVLLNQTAPPNQPPLADAGRDAIIECTSPDGARVLFDGSGSTDPDSSPGTHDDIVSFEWYEDFASPSPLLLGAGATLSVYLSLGTHELTLRVTDGAGETDTDTTLVTVSDTVAPNVSLVVAPESLWPPNHRMVDVEAMVTADDACGEPTVRLRSIVSNEPEVGTGAGQYDTDIADADLGTADFSFYLRAERIGSGKGRVYSVCYSAEDLSGNSVVAGASVTVPHDRRQLTSIEAIEPCDVQAEGEAVMIRRQ